MSAWSPLCSQRISVNVSLGLTLITILAKDYLIDKKEKFQCVLNPIHLLTPTSHAYPFNVQRSKIVRNTLRWSKKIWQEFESVSDHFGRLFINKINKINELKTYRLINALKYPSSIH